MLDVEAFILVGGESSRMGEDKSRLLVNGKTTVSLITEALRPVTSSIRTVGSHLEQVSEFGVPPLGRRVKAELQTTDPLENIPDLQTRWGPLGGIEAALRAGRSKFCVVVACDLPFVTTALFAYLLSFAEASEACDAIVPMQEDGRPQPLCGVYRREPCLTATENAIADNQHSPRAMLDRVSTRYITFNELTNLPGSDHFFFNLNRPEDYERAKEIADGEDPTSSLISKSL